MGHGVGQAVDPHFDPHLKVHFYNEKHPKSEDFRLFLELLGRFELPTSSLPSVPDNLFVLLFVHVFSKTAYFLQTFICK